MAVLSRAKAIKLRDTISGMNETQQREIYRILCDHKIVHTVKSDGIFFEDSALTKPAVTDIEAYIRFCHDLAATA